MASTVPDRVEIELLPNPDVADMMEWAIADLSPEEQAVFVKFTRLVAESRVLGASAEQIKSAIERGTKLPTPKHPFPKTPRPLDLTFSVVGHQLTWAMASSPGQNPSARNEGTEEEEESPAKEDADEMDDEFLPDSDDGSDDGSDDNSTGHSDEDLLHEELMDISTEEPAEEELAEDERPVQVVRSQGGLPVISFRFTKQKH